MPSRPLILAFFFSILTAFLLSARLDSSTRPNYTDNPLLRVCGLAARPASASPPARPVSFQSPAASLQQPAPYQLFLPLVFKPPLFTETFDGMPAGPLPWSSPNWDVTIHTRDELTPTTLTPMQADHGVGCEPPPATHLTASYDGAVFQCHDHIMTALNEAGYGVVYLTPRYQVDLSRGVAAISFDISTRRTSNRDWIDLWVTPFDQNLQFPLQTFYPDLNGPPRQAVHIYMDSFNGLTPFRAEIYNNFTSTAVPGNFYTGYEQFLTPSATRRDTFQLLISPTHIKFGMPAYNFWWIDRDIPALGWSAGIVQLGHHSYNPSKACGFDGACGPNTWHWDNVSILPAVPFTMLHADRRFVDAAADSVTLSAPAPAGAHLRFAGLGNSMDVSFDGGQTWSPAQLQSQLSHVEGHAWSYWTPIPAGAAQVRFRGANWYGGPWEARDITVWSLIP